MSSVCVSAVDLSTMTCCAASSQNSSPLEPPGFPARGESPQPRCGKTPSLAAVCCDPFLALKGLAGSPCNTAWPMALHPASLTPPARAASASNELALGSPSGTLTFPQSCYLSPWIQAVAWHSLLKMVWVQALSDPSLQLWGLWRIL